MNRLLTWYYHRCLRYSSTRFIFELLTLSFILKMVPAVGISLLGIEDFTTTTDVVSQDGPFAIIVSTILIAPRDRNP